MNTSRPHVLGIDDAPFDKGQIAPVPIVGVMMEGADLVESVAITAFPVDGSEAATECLVEWIKELRSFESLQAIILGGITIAGLGVVDISAMSRRLSVPVLSVTRMEPSDLRLLQALDAAGLSDRREIVQRSPRASRVDAGVFAAHSGLDVDDAHRIVRGTRSKARIPEPLRVAHLIGRALVTGESRGGA